MGQYFAAANLDKKEFVCPWCIGGGAKLWEWAANTTGSIFTLLLRKSSQSGGGDYGCTPTSVDVTGDPGGLATAVAAALTAEGQPFQPDDEIVGRWAGDRVVLIGDYDSSKLWDELYRQKSYRNISRELVDTWNEFIELPDRQLTFHPDCTCCQIDS